MNTSGTPVRCDIPFTDLDVTNAILLQFIGLTGIVTAFFICLKVTVDTVRRRCARLTVLVVGAGPIGLTSALIAGRNDKVCKLILYEECSRYDLVNRKNQVAFDPSSVSFLTKYGVDFDNLEGCRHNGRFFTRVGVYLEYLLSVLDQLELPVEINLNQKFTNTSMKNPELSNGRLLAIACDGSNGVAANILGLSDSVKQHTCKTYGAVAALERKDQPMIPLPDTKIHDINFDMTAYGMDTIEQNGHQGFHFKLFGSPRWRYMSLCIPKCDTKLVKALRVILDRSMMRNIFLKCFNTYKSTEESYISDSVALKCMKFSSRLFEIKLSEREETATYYEDFDMFVVSEGDSARSLNFHTGIDVNIGLKGLKSVQEFINRIAWADNEHTILEALQFKANHSKQITKQFLMTGLKDHMFT